MPLFHVVRVNRSNSDTRAARSLAGALDLAMADPGDTIEVQEVEASDAGAARLTTSPLWAALSTPRVPFGWDAVEGGAA